jgi:hypothetical protein
VVPLLVNIFSTLGIFSSSEGILATRSEGSWLSWKVLHNFLLCGAMHHASCQMIGTVLRSSPQPSFCMDRVNELPNLSSVSVGAANASATTANESKGSRE